MRALARVALSVALLAAPVAAQAPAGLADSDVKAAFVYNFAKFADWPRLPARATILACVVGDTKLADALGAIVRGKDIAGHGLSVAQPQQTASWSDCQLLFIAGSQVSLSVDGLASIRKLPVLTVSDGTGFSKAGGIVELFVDSGRMRFAINVDAVERSGLRLSSRLLGLATVVRDSNGR